MKIFSKIYDMAMRWATHPRASLYLMGLSFMEASFFPIPPDVMLAPMSLAKPDKAWRYASLATLFSTLGGLFGYLIGMFFIVLLLPFIHKVGYYPSYVTVESWFAHWGFWAMLIAGFTPIPFKLFTIAAGAAHMPLLPFVIAALLGRAGRFFLVASLMVLGGEKMEQFLRRYVDWIGWGVLVVLLLILYLYH